MHYHPMIQLYFILFSVFWQQNIEKHLKNPTFCVTIVLDFEKECFPMDDEKNENQNEERREIRVVSGNPDDLDISPVYDHIEIEKPTKEKKKQTIIVPEEKKNS